MYSSVGKGLSTIFAHFLVDVGVWDVSLVIGTVTTDGAGGGEVMSVAISCLGVATTLRGVSLSACN